MFMYNMALRNSVYALRLAGIDEHDVLWHSVDDEQANTGQLLQIKECNVRKIREVGPRDAGRFLRGAGCEGCAALASVWPRLAARPTGE